MIEKKKQEWLDLIDAWMEGGGDGIVAINTYMVQRESVPVKHWGYPSAGMSGSTLHLHRQVAIRAARKAFPEATIIATGGIDSVDQAWGALESGANALAGYTPYTFQGFGLVTNIAEGLHEKLSQIRSISPSKYQLSLQK